METTTTTDLNEILTSKQFSKHGNLFKSPVEILQPVIDIFGMQNITGFGSHPVTIGENEEELTAFGRAGIVKSFEIDEELNYQIGFLYSLEYNKPFIKVFSGINVKICSNMCIFNSEHLEKIDINTHGYNKAYEKVQNFINKQAENCEQAKKLIAEMKNTQLTFNEVQNFFGKILFAFSQPQKNIAGTQAILKGAKLLNDKSTHYYFDNITTAWNVFNSLTDDFREKTHIIDHPEKVWNIYLQMLSVIEPQETIEEIEEVQHLLN